MLNDLQLSLYTVKVGSGSGCIFDPASDEYLYVFTAAHNIIDGEPLIVTAQYVSENGQTVEKKLEIIGGPFKHANDDIDATIIKIKRFEWNHQVLILEDLSKVSEPLNLCGYPTVRREQDFQFRSDKLTLHNPKPNGYFEGSVNGNATYDELVGISGGPILYIESKKVFLIGIQSKMATHGAEALGRVEFMPVSLFREIVDQNKDDLADLFPPHLLSFSYLMSQAMQLKGCLIDRYVSYTRSRLASIAQEIVDSSLTPIYIRDLFKERLLLYGEDVENLSCKGLWVAWLEFLVIMRIIYERHIMPEDLEAVFNNYRLIHSTTEEDWAEEMPNIIRSDYEGLTKDGKIIISTMNKPVHLVIPPGLVPDIINSSDTQKGELKIDDGIVHPLKAYKLVHIHAFQDTCVVSKATDYKGFNVTNDDEMLVKLRTEYNALFD